MWIVFIKLHRERLESLHFHQLKIIYCVVTVSYNKFNHLNYSLI